MQASPARIWWPLTAAAGVAGIAGLVYLPVWLHRHDPPPPSITRRPENVTIADVPDATLAGRHNGRKIWQFHAADIRVAADGHTTAFRGIDRGTLYRNEKPAARVSAAQAVYNDDTGRLTVSGGLTLAAGEAVARTTRLEWDAKKDTVSCPDEVTLTWPGGIARVGSLETNAKMTQITGRRASAAAQIDNAGFRKLVRQLGVGAATASLAAFLAAPAMPQGQPVKYKEVRFTNADRWRWDQATDTSVYEGNVSAIQGDTSFRADRIVYRKGSNSATVSGHITVENPRNRITGDTAEVDFNARTVTLRGAGGVLITVLPPKGGADAGSLRAKLKDPVTIACKSVNYSYKEKRAAAEGPITVNRRAQKVTGDSGVYVAEGEIVTLTGNVHGTDEKNQTFDAPAVTMSLKPGAEWMEARNVQAKLYVKDEEEQPATPGAAKAPSAP